MADKAKAGTAAQGDTTRGATERMTDAARGAAEQMRDGAAKASEAFHDHVVEPARRADEAMKASGQKIAESGSAIGTRMIDQAEANAREAFAAMRAAAGAKDLTEVMRIQGDFLREQGARSMAQAREVGEMIAQFGRDAVETVRGDAKGEPPTR